MTITWLGHSCFRIDCGRGGVVILDPYRDGSVPGLELPDIGADAVVCSHAHDDHAGAELIRMANSMPGFAIEQISCWHDEQGGALRGENKITIINAEGLRVAHLGDLGHELDEETLQRLGHVDVLLIPVGGYYTIDAQTAKRVADAIGAAVTVPMHYRGEGFGYPVLGTVEDFASLCGDVVYAGKNSFVPQAGEAKKTLILKVEN